MDFKDSIKQFAERVSSLKENILTEEATKNAFIMPFIQQLGYDVFNPLEVVPEMNCDLVKKKGEKLDYAIMRDGEPIILIECKHWEKNLNLHETQLKKYFVASNAKFGVLTNGIRYRFYSDLEKENIMDDAPFLEIDLENLRDAQIEELKKFHKSYFDIDNILGSASELKYMSEIKSLLRTEFSAPSPDFVRLFAKQVYSSPITQRVLDQFSDIVKRALNSHVTDIITERLNIAIPQEPVIATQAPAEQEEDNIYDDKPKIITTEEELEGFHIVKALCGEVFSIDRIFQRDTMSYFGILADNNNRKPICRLYFNNARKRIAIFDAEKNENFYDLPNGISDIYALRNELQTAAKLYL